MAKKYIDAERLERNGWYLQRTVTYSSAATGGYGYTETLKPTDYPAADVQEVKHGRWIKSGQSFIYPSRFMNYCCSICGHDLDRQIRTLPNYCPNCGSLMDEEKVRQGDEV